MVTIGRAWAIVSWRFASERGLAPRRRVDGATDEPDRQARRGSRPEARFRSDGKATQAESRPERRWLPSCRSSSWCRNRFRCHPLGVWCGWFPRSVTLIGAPAVLDGLNRPSGSCRPFSRVALAL